MAIINSVLGTMKGKLGNLSTRKAQGNNIIYARAQEVQNPRTSAQMTQRVKLANVVTLYRVLRGFLEAYAFENKPVKRSVYNEFCSLNIAGNTVYLTKDAVKAGACVVAPYVITKGTLPMIGVQGYGTGAVTDIAVTASSFANATVGDFARDIIANNPRFHAGDQLSYVSLIQQIGADGLPHISCRIYEVILDPTSAAQLSSYMPARAIAVSGGFLGHSSEALTGAFAWIMSRKEGGKVRVSTQALVLSSADINVMFNNLEKAILSYGENNVPFLDPSQAGTVDGSQSSVTVPSVASVDQNGTVLSQGMRGKGLTTDAIIVTGSNFASTLTYTSNVNGTSLTVTRVSDTKLSIAMPSAINSNLNWTLNLQAGGYSFVLASNTSGVVEG